MIQDIFPYKYHNEYRNIAAEDSDYVIPVHQQRILCSCTETKASLPTAAEAERIWKIDRKKLRYLFAIDEMNFFLWDQDLEETAGFRWEHILTVRGLEPACISFAAAVGAHLAHWYENNRYCGKCGQPYSHSKTQRALVCPACGQVAFPRINPIVIAAVVDGDRLLVARYNKKHFNPRNNQYVLLAGYVEIGESYEDTVRREIREETGLEIRRIRYVASQPWPYSQTSIAGFYVEADSRRPLKIQEDELSELVWVKREDLPPRKNLTSITDNLIEWFRHGKTVEEIRKELE